MATRDPPATDPPRQEWPRVYLGTHGRGAPRKPHCLRAGATRLTGRGPVLGLGFTELVGCLSRFAEAIHRRP